MRPDEHKKKRSAQYNKKKGVKVENKSAEDKGVGKRDLKSRGAEQQHEQQQQRQIAVDAPKQTSAASCSDNEVSVTSQKTFRRREIVSNWNRYEVTETEVGSEEPQSSGVDYTKLLSVTANASSHFRFKDEADWEEELSGCHGDANQAAAVLVIDCADLAASLQCLPLYHRLGLSPHLFPEEQRKQLQEDAAKSRQEYNRTHGPGSRSSVQGEIMHTGQTAWGEEDCEDVRGDQSDERIVSRPNKLSASLIQTKHPSSSKRPTEQEIEKLSKQQTKTDEQKVTVSEVRTTDQVHTAMGCESESAEPEKLSKNSGQVVVSAKQEEELDFLLSIDAMSDPLDGHSVGDVTRRPVPVQSKKTEVDSSPAAPPAAPAAVPPTVPPTAGMDNPQSEQSKVVGKTSAPEDLEDWLDSILED